MLPALFSFSQEIGRTLVSFKQLGKLCDGGVLKDLDRRNLAPEAGMELADHAHGGQRIAAQIEETVVDSDFFQLQQFAPQAGQLLFHLSPGRDKVLRKQRPFILRRGKRLPIHF